MFVKTDKPVELAKEIFWLAWQACGSPLGMGFLQNYPNATKEDVWNNVVNAGDYPGKAWNKEDNPYADYVFGRRMKFGLSIKSDGVDIFERSLRSDYQSWCVTYPTIKDLVDKAVDNENGK